MFKIKVKIEKLMILTRHRMVPDLQKGKQEEFCILFLDNDKVAHILI
jgi:hypothetical protein